LAVCQAVIWDIEKWNRDTNEGEPEGWQRAMNSGRANRYPPNSTAAKVRQELEHEKFG